MNIDAATLSRTFQAEVDTLNAFIGHLREEQQALVHGELDRLGAFAGAKSNCVLTLTRLAEQRTRWLRERGLTANRTGMDRLLQEHAGNHPQLRGSWQKVLELMRTAQQINDINGTLIGTRLNGTQRALSVLFSAANVAGSYASDGSTTVAYRRSSQLAVA